ncbi:MAG: hypothetical protein RL111_2602 [Pseudomonadota bacterium]
MAPANQRLRRMVVVSHLTPFMPLMRGCTPARTRHNIEQIVRLGTYSRETLQQLRQATGLNYDQRTQGSLQRPPRCWR